MWNKISDYYFWFSQSATILSPEDKILLYIPVTLLALAIVFRILASTSKNEVTRKLWKKYWHLALAISLGGISWFGVRFENTPIFGQRYWAGINLIIGIIWLMFILKFTFFDYREQKKEFERELMKSKYLPKPR